MITPKQGVFPFTTQVFRPALSTGFVPGVCILQRHDPRHWNVADCLFTCTDMLWYWTKFSFSGRKQQLARHTVPSESLLLSWKYDYISFKAEFLTLHCPTNNHNLYKNQKTMLFMTSLTKKTGKKTELESSCNHLKAWPVCFCLPSVNVDPLQTLWLIEITWAAAANPCADININMSKSRDLPDSDWIWEEKLGRKSTIPSRRVEAWQWVSVCWSSRERQVATPSPL